MNFNKRTWIKSTKCKNSTFLAGLFGSISKTDYVPVLAYAIKDIVDQTVLSDSTVRRTIKKLMESGHLFALRNTNLSGKQKIYIATFPKQERLESFDIAIDALRRFKRDFGSLETFILTGRNVHFDRLNRSLCTFQTDLPIINQKLIIDLVGSEPSNSNSAIRLNETYKKPTKKRGQLSLNGLDAPQAPKLNEKGKGVDTRLKTAALSRKQPVALRKTKVDLILNELDLPRQNEIREAWSIYFDDAAAGELKSKVARMRLKFPLRAISKMLIEDGWTHHEVEPAAVEDSESLDRWREQSDRIRAAKSILENDKIKQNTKWNEYTDNAKNALYDIQYRICDAEDELEKLQTKPNKTSRELTTKMSEPSVADIFVDMGISVSEPETAPFDIRAALSQLKKTGVFDDSE